MDPLNFFLSFEGVGITRFFGRGDTLYETLRFSRSVNCPYFIGALFICPKRLLDFIIGSGILDLRLLIAFPF